VGLYDSTDPKASGMKLQGRVTFQKSEDLSWHDDELIGLLLILQW
jgi:hypothetical protein